jgi:hypothetical protein
VVELPSATNHDLYPYVLARWAARAAERGDLDHAEDICQKALNAAGRLRSEDEQRRVEFVVAVARYHRTLPLGQWRESADCAEQASRIARELRMGAAAAGYLAFAATGHTMAGDPQAGVDLAKKAWSWPAPSAHPRS